MTDTGRPSMPATLTAVLRLSKNAVGREESIGDGRRSATCSASLVSCVKWLPTAPTTTMLPLNRSRIYWTRYIYCDKSRLGARAFCYLSSNKLWFTASSSPASKGSGVFNTKGNSCILQWLWHIIETKQKINKVANVCAGRSNQPVVVR